MAHKTTQHFAGREFPSLEYTFDSMIVSDPNRDACSAAAEILEQPSPAPLIVCGGSGSGKTHLLHAIHHALLARTPSAVVIHMNADDFTARLLHSIHDGCTEQLRSELCRADAFLLDDVQFLAEKTATQEELLHILEHRFKNGRLSIMTLNCPAQRLVSVENHLRTHFPTAVLVSLAAPDRTICTGFIQRKSAQLELHLSDEEIALIAERFPGNLPGIHGMLKRISLYQAFPDVLPDARSISDVIQMPIP